MRSQKTAFVNGLCTLSRDVKRLTVKEFNDRFDCDVVEMITRQLANVGMVDGSEDDGGSLSSGKKRNRVIGMQQQQLTPIMQPQKIRLSQHQPML